MNYSINETQLQVLLSKMEKDFIKSYKTRRILYDFFRKEENKKADRLIDCSRIVTSYQSIEGKAMLTNRCKIRFCPTCEKINAIQRYININNILNKVNFNNNEYIVYHYIFTCRNTTEDKLKKHISGLNKAVTSFYRHYKIKDYTRRMEVTYNTSNDTYHPHIHSISIIPINSFLNCKEKQKEDFINKLNVIRKTWHEHLLKADVEDNSIEYNLVYARPLKNIKDILECVKYSVKPSSIKSGNVENFVNNLKGLKLFSGSGIFRKLKENEENESSINIIENAIYQTTYYRDNTTGKYKIIRYSDRTKNVFPEQ